VHRPLPSNPVRGTDGSPPLRWSVRSFGRSPSGLPQRRPCLSPSVADSEAGLGGRRRSPVAGARRQLRAAV